MNENEIGFITKRLEIRNIKPSDALSMYKYRSDPQIYKFQYWKPQSVQDVEDFICDKIAKTFNIPDTWYQLSIFIKGFPELIGDIGIHFIEADHLQVEIGYTLSIEHQGKGYASEAIEGVIDYLFHTYHKHRIFASVDPDNIKSIAVLERMGMRKEAHFKKSIWHNGKWVDDIIYSILEEEWRKEK